VPHAGGQLRWGVRIKEWQTVAIQQNEATQNLIVRAIALSKTGVLNQSGHGGDLNDEYLGAFFASGDKQYIQRVVDQLALVDDREDENNFFVGGTAKWALAGISRSAPQVRQLILDCRTTASPRVQQIIDELLVEGPAQVRREIRDIYAQQKTLGKWK